MNLFGRSLIASAALLVLSNASVTYAKRDAEPGLAQKQAELDRQRIELEKKSLELKQQELDLEKERADFQAQESARSLSMNLSGDVLFDYDKATLKPAAEEALKKVAVVLS